MHSRLRNSSGVSAHDVIRYAPGDTLSTVIRGTEESTGSPCSYVDLEARAPRAHSLRALRDLTNVALREMLGELMAHCSHTSRPTIGVENVNGYLSENTAGQDIKQSERLTSRRRSESRTRPKLSRRMRDMPGTERCLRTESLNTLLLGIACISMGKPRPREKSKNS